MERIAGAERIDCVDGKYGHAPYRTGLHPQDVVWTIGHRQKDIDGAGDASQ